ncbi:MAG: diaminopimelate epimerase [Armatimonadetes bacterium]|nr:diaminopimelate epimerase [Armatimonadota bacterium]
MLRPRGFPLESPRRAVRGGLFPRGRRGRPPRWRGRRARTPSGADTRAARRRCLCRKALAIPAANSTWVPYPRGAFAHNGDTGPLGGPWVLTEANTFVKSHALGNDYIVVDPGRLTAPLTPAVIRRICDRHTGVGSDGILALAPTTRADFGLRIFYPDGSEAEKSGNGLRIFVRFLYDHGYTRRSRFTIDTLGGLVDVTLELNGGKIRQMTLDVGKATFMSQEIPVAGSPREVVDETIEVQGKPLRITAVSVGNPHCVVFVDDLASVPLHALGPALENHPLFPQRTNVQFVRVESRSVARILIWERGAGETMASGTSSCAVAAACVRKGLTDRDVTVAMAGGDLRIHVSEDFSLRLAGDAQEVYQGRLSEGMLGDLRALSR